MVNSGALADIFSVEGGIWGIFLVLFLLTVRVWNSVPAIMGQWVEWRKVKAAEKAADWSRLREMLEQERREAAEFRVAQLAENQKCREELKEKDRELAEVHQRLARLEGFATGMGDARQEAAVLSGTRRMIERDAEDLGE